METINYEAEIERAGDATFEGLIALGFKLLRRQGYLARMNYMCCMSCAHAGLEADAEKRAKVGRPVKGIVYFHHQDKLRAGDRPNAEGQYEQHIRYSAVTDNEQDTLVVGEAVCEIFTGLFGAQGVEWSHNPNTTIVLLSAPVDNPKSASRYGYRGRYGDGAEAQPIRPMDSLPEAWRILSGEVA